MRSPATLRSARALAPAFALAALSLLLAGGCATRESGRGSAPWGGGTSGGGSGAAQAPAAENAQRKPLPDLVAGRFAPPPHATRQIGAARGAVFEAALGAVNGLGYAVSRVDGAGGKLFAARRQASGFDGSREYTLELSVLEVSPDAADLRVVLRETIEDSAGRVSSGIVRDRVAYDAIFDRVTSALGLEPVR